MALQSKSIESLDLAYWKNSMNQRCLLSFQVEVLRCERQKPFPVVYKSHEIGAHRLDVLVEDSVVVELKAVEKMTPIALPYLCSIESAKQEGAASPQSC